MKEIIVEEIKKLSPYINNSYSTFRTEQVPETWEELKKLCYEKDIDVFNDVIYAGNYCSLTFRKNGIVGDSNNGMVAKGLTPQQMWAIIKNLIGEK